jgi:hypothetical protein
MASRNGVGTANATISQRLIERCKNVSFISIFSFIALTLDKVLNSVLVGVLLVLE